MAEIKSTLELALERTKKISISEKEKDEIKQKETLQKVKGISHRYREGYLPLSEMMKEIEKMEEGVATMIKEALLSQWIDALSLNDEGERLLKGIESLQHQGIEGVKQTFHHLLSQYRNKKEKIEQEVRAQLLESLEKEGIYGSAVEPKIEGSKLLKKENEKLDRSYRMKLEEIKEQLRGL